VAIFVSKYFTKVFSRTSNGKTTIFVVQHLLGYVDLDLSKQDLRGQNPLVQKAS
jgi:hypothetical protein